VFHRPRTEPSPETEDLPDGFVFGLPMADQQRTAQTVDAVLVHARRRIPRVRATLALALWMRPGTG
jgi:hypothetical protein